MSLQKRIDALVADLERHKETEGGTAVDTSILIDILRELRSQKDFREESRLRRYERKLDVWAQSKLEVTRAVFLFGQNAIRSLFLANGAAAVALLAFLGAMVDAGENELAKELSVSLWWFSIGVTSSAVVGMASYVTQFLYDGSVGKTSNWGVGFHIVAVTFAVASVLSFLVGISVSYGVFRAL